MFLQLRLPPFMHARQCLPCVLVLPFFNSIVSPARRLPAFSLLLCHAVCMRSCLVHLFASAFCICPCACAFAPYGGIIMLA